MNTATALIGNDHGGYRLKLEIMEHLNVKGFPIHNVVLDSEEIIR